MATPGRPLDYQTRNAIARDRANGASIRETARRQMVSVNTVQKYEKIPLAK
jgi:hypothetical protein